MEHYWGPPQRVLNALFQGGQFIIDRFFNKEQLCHIRIEHDRTSFTSEAGSEVRIGQIRMIRDVLPVRDLVQFEPVTNKRDEYSVVTTALMERIYLLWDRKREPTTHETANRSSEPLWNVQRHLRSGSYLVKFPGKEWNEQMDIPPD